MGNYKEHMNKTSTTPKKFCFVLMPFTEDFDDIYNLGIKQSCIDAGTYCERVDEQIFHESILERIYNQISKADIIIADMTGKNPNVFYEVGYAHALGKLTVLLTQNSEDIPFDLKHYPHIIYNKKISKLKNDLTPRIKKFAENEKTSELDFIIDLDIYHGKENLSLDNVTYITERSSIPCPSLTIHNKTFNTYHPGDYRIGILTSKNFTHLRNDFSTTIDLPDGNNLHMLANIKDLLYPNSYIGFRPLIDSSYGRNREPEVITIRLFTPSGYRDYKLKIDFE
jgi:hypothetical protein